MIRTKYMTLPLMIILTACSSIPTSTPHQTATAIVATGTQTPTHLSATITPSPFPITTIISSELGGSQAWIEKNFKPYGFQFGAPYGDGERIAGHGRLALHKEHGDLYDMEIEINTVSIEYSLLRAQFVVLVYQRLSDSEMRYILELLHLFLTTSTIIDGTEATTWIDATLPRLESFKGREAKTNFGIIQSRMNLGGWSSDAGDGYTYSLTLWVDPRPTKIGDTIHISVEAITPLQEGDRLSLSCWDYEDPDTAIWSTSSACVPPCETDNPTVVISNTKITVYEGFPITHDQWLIKMQLDEWGYRRYTPYTFELEINFHNQAYACLNIREFSVFENFGQATIFADYNDGEWIFDSEDLICTVK